MPAAQFLQIRADSAELQPLLDPRDAGFNFDQIAGLSYEIDPSQPSRYAPDGRLVDRLASRIRELRWQGLPVSDGQSFLLVTNSFRAAGGGGYPRLPEERLVLDLADESRQAVAAYLRASPRHQLPAPGGWRLRLPAGVQLSLPVGPGALNYLEELAGVSPLPGETAATGLATLGVDVEHHARQAQLGLKHAQIGNELVGGAALLDQIAGPGREPGG